MAADAWDADRSFFLLNGSTAGNHAFLLATVRPGDKVIVSRDLHKSLLVALILTGAVPVYLAPRLHPELNVGLGISADEVAAALELHPDTKLVVLVSPSYCGVASDLEGIAAVAHARRHSGLRRRSLGTAFPVSPRSAPFRDGQRRRRRGLVDPQGTGRSHPGRDPECAR